MGSCENLDAVHESSHGAVMERHSCLEFSEELISTQNLCSEAVGNLIDPKKNSTFEPDECCFDSQDNNAGCVGSSEVMESGMNDRDDEVKGYNECGTDPGPRHSVQNESGVCLTGCNATLGVCEAETDALCSEKQGSLQQDWLSGSLVSSQLPLVEKPVMESPRRSLGGVEQMEDGNAQASLREGHLEGPSDGLVVILNDNRNQTLLPEQCELSQQLIPETVLQVNFVKQDEGKDIRNINCSFVPVVLGNIQGEDDLLTNAEEDPGESIMPSEGIETASELASMTRAPENCIKQHEVLKVTENRNDVVIGGEGISKCTTEDELDSNSLSTNGMEGDTCIKISVTQCGEMKSLGTNEFVSKSHAEGYEKDDKIFGDLCAHLKDTADAKGVHVKFDEAAPLKDLQEADLQGDISEKKELLCKQNVDCLSNEIADTVLEENSDVTADVKAENSQQISPVEDNACGSTVGSIINGSSLMLDVPDVSGKGAVGVLGASNGIDCLRSADNEAKENVEVPCVSEPNNSEAILSYFRREGKKDKLTQKAQAKRTAIGSRKAARKKQSQENLELIFKCARQKRSCYSKPARSSEWGLSRSVAQMVWQRGDVAPDESLNQASDRSQGFQSSEKQRNDCPSGSPKGPSRKNRASNGCCIRLKVKFGKTGGLNPMSGKLLKGDHSTSTNDYGNELHQGAVLEFPKSADCEEVKSAIEETKGQTNYNTKQDKNMSDGDQLDSLVDTKHKDKGFECGVLCEKSARDAANDDLKLALNKAVEEPARPTENRSLDAGTSPDSEVINSVPDALVGLEHQGDLHRDILRSKAFATPVDLNDKNKGKKKGKKKDATNKSKPQKNGRSRRKRVLLREAEPRVFGESLEMESREDAQICPSVDSHLVESQSSKKMPALNEFKVHRRSKTSKCSGMKNEKSDSSKSRRRNASGHKKDQQKPTNRSKEKEEDAGDRDVGRLDFHYEIGCHIVDDIANTDIINHVAFFNAAANGDMVLGRAAEESASIDSAWVRCDDCFKWRRIPVSLVESIDDNCRWVCKDNLDKDFADCSISQEMSNEEINTELGMTQAEADAYDGDMNFKEVDKGLEGKRVAGNRKACFKAIKINQFLHRNRKAQTIDEIMVCHCKPQPDGQLGCRDECLNRMLNIECVQGTCPCGDLCSNQQFQKRKYTKFVRFQSGKKGYGLKLLEDVCKGQFLIEYVGEVLDMQAYEERQKDYAANSQKHFYFMTLNGNEVIDAGVKGNLGRFINHSCEPNCRTEKWMVNGEICVGIFALRDIKQGEEVTFDYNYVRVFGAAAKKCHCGSPHCRGYIGGDSLNGDVIVQSDSDEEYPEPVMLEDDETVDSVLEATSGICTDDAEVQIAQNQMKDNEKKKDSRTDVRSSIATEIEDSKGYAVSAVLKMQSSVSVEDLEKLPSPVKPSEASLSEGDLTIKSIAAVQHGIPVEGGSTSGSASSNKILETSSIAVSRLPSDSADTEMKSKYISGEDAKILRRSRPLLKTPRPSGSVKKEKGGSNPLGGSKLQTMVANKPQQQANKSKGSTEVSSSGRPETVEEKLNELLEAEGGISKRKDSTKGYLKLLLLTAASRGNASNEGIQSNRDLSMILDALLKTKSRAVLVDIINKNGLQMLHNIMKQYRRDFKRIPILRKLLKVLEYLAAREILTLEHIIRGPPCVGMESFRDSMLTLTEHDDKQVHQIARNFRDRWIPKPFRKPRCMNRDESRMEFQRDPNCNRFSLPKNHHRHDHDATKPTEPVPSVMLPVVAAASDNVSVSHTGVSQTNDTKVRKRKSRWDQPAMNKEQKTDSLLFQPAEDVNKDMSNQDNQDDIPPGFSSSFKQPSIPSNSAPDIVVAHPQPKFLSRMPVSYGIPLNILQEFGTPQAEAPDRWSVAPAMTFHPFPPLPPFPRENYINKTPPSVNSTTANENGPPTTCSGDRRASTTIPGHANSGYKRPRGSSNDLGRNYFRQQKWNVPPWIRNGWGMMGNNFRGGTDCVGPAGFVPDEKLYDSYCSQGTGPSGAETTSRYSSDQQQRH